MSDRNYNATISVDQSPKEAFDGIRNVRGWWSEEIEGNTAKVGAQQQAQGLGDRPSQLRGGSD